MKSSVTVVDWFLLALLVVSWGSSFAMTKVAVAALEPSWVMALRLAVAALALVPFAAMTGHSFTLPVQTWRGFIWLGLTGYVAPFLLISWGTHLVPSGVAGLLMGVIPLFMVMAAHVLLPDDRLTWLKAAGFVLGFLGILVLIMPNASLGSAFSGEALWGEFAILLGCVCYVAHSISAKRMGFLDPVLQTAAICLLSAGIGAAFAFIQSPAGLMAMTGAALWSVVGLGLLPTAFASVVMYRLMERTGPSFVSFSNYLVPLYAVLFGAATLGESLSWNMLAALALILAGIAISRMKPRRSLSRSL
jgi:drug/metabolite transporter (DMT)-like permease